MFIAGSTGFIGVQLVKLLCKHKYIKIKYLCEIPQLVKEYILMTKN